MNIKELKQRLESEKWTKNRIRELEEENLQLIDQIKLDYLINEEFGQVWWEKELDQIFYRPFEDYGLNEKYIKLLKSRRKNGVN